MAQSHRGSRRAFLRQAGAASAVAVTGFPMVAHAAPARVVVVGGGFGGATAARYLKYLDPKLQVTLIDRDARYITCPFSNYVLGGFYTMNQITHSRNALQSKFGVTLVADEATRIDTAARKISLKGGQTLSYDKVVVAPGIDILFEAVPGYSEKASEVVPHAWKAGAQTMLLRRQLEAMPDGGTVIVAPPANPFRCPPGPYERVSMIAWHLKSKKPKSKILILDAKDAFSKQGLFQAAWDNLYPGMITWIAGKEGGKVEGIDVAGMTVKSGFGSEKAAVINLIPPQRAGKIAVDSGLAAASGWCPINPATFASTQAPNVYVIGDASVAGAMPKSGSSANSQAKTVAAAIVSELQGKGPVSGTFANTCYSLVAPDYGISVTGTYVPGPNGIVEVPNSGGVSAAQAPAATRQAEVTYAESWYKGIVTDAFG